MLKDLRMERIYSSVRHLDDMGICDVGTDHAHIPIELVKNGIVPFAIATDISNPSIEKGKINIISQGLGEKIKTYCANGTLGVPLDKIGDVIIAGMGGELIASIILADPRLKNEKFHFVLQPMTKQTVLRNELAKNGYRIEKEYCVADGERLYFVMSVYYDGIQRKLSEIELLLGVNTEKDQALLCYSKKLLDQLEVRKKGLESADTIDKKEIESVSLSINSLKTYLNS